MMFLNIYDLIKFRQASSLTQWYGSPISLDQYYCKKIWDAMQYLDYLQDTFTIFMIHNFVKVPQSHDIHNKVVQFVLSQDRQKIFPNYFQDLKHFCINW